MFSQGKEVTYVGAKKQYSEAEGGKYNINYTDNELIMKDGKPWLNKDGKKVKNPLKKQLSCLRELEILIIFAHSIILILVLA